MLRPFALWKLTPGEPCEGQSGCPGNLELGSFYSYRILSVWVNERCSGTRSVEDTCRVASLGNGRLSLGIWAQKVQEILAMSGGAKPQRPEMPWATASRCLSHLPQGFRLGWVEHWV